MAPKIKPKHWFYVTLTTKKSYSYSALIGVLADMLHKSKTFTDYCLYPELSKDLMFHFHGFIQGTNKKDIYTFKSNWERTCGWTKFEDDSNHDKLSKVRILLYCQKDKAQWQLRISKYNYKQIKQWAVEKYLKIPKSESKVYCHLYSFADPPGEGYPPL